MIKDAKLKRNISIQLKTKSEKKTAKFDGNTSEVFGRFDFKSTISSRSYGSMVTWSRNLWRFQWTMLFTTASSEDAQEVCDHSMCVYVLYSELYDKSIHWLNSKRECWHRAV